MEARELRIDNLVNYGFNSVPIKSIHTESILKNEVRVYVELNEKLQNYCLDINEIEPIPLTEEWLLKFGFNKRSETCFKMKNYFIDFKIDEVFNINYIILSEWRSYHCQYFNVSIIKYVHQLQNLYFALTQKELVYEKTV